MFHISYSIVLSLILLRSAGIVPLIPSRTLRHLKLIAEVLSAVDLAAWWLIVVGLREAIEVARRHLEAGELLATGLHEGAAEALLALVAHGAAGGQAASFGVHAFALEIEVGGVHAVALDV